MLTSDLLRIRRKDGQLLPRYLNKKHRSRLEPIADAMIQAISQGNHSSRSELESTFESVCYSSSDRIIVQGLRKLLLDRCKFTTPDGPDPGQLRQCVWRLAAEQRRALGPGEQLDRKGVLAQCAGEFDISSELAESRLFADLRENEQLQSFRALRSHDLLDRYNVALAQGVLLRATRVVVQLEGEAPGPTRQLFRAARFHGLIHRVTQPDENVHRIELDGPFSLFSAVQRYGLKLAMFLPSLLRCRSWTLKADILWGKSRQAASFKLDPSQELKPCGAPITGVAPELQDFCERFRALESAWTVKPNDEIFAFAKEPVCVPDLRFSNGDTGEQVYLEAFGFWSRTAVWQRVESLRRGFPARILLAVGKQLRVSEDVLSPDDSGELYVYANTMSPRAVLKRLEAAKDC